MQRDIESALSSIISKSIQQGTLSTNTTQCIFLTYSKNGQHAHVHSSIVSKPHAGTVGKELGQIELNAPNHARSASKPNDPGPDQDRVAINFRKLFSQINYRNFDQVVGMYSLYKNNIDLIGFFMEGGHAPLFGVRLKHNSQSLIGYLLISNEKITFVHDQELGSTSSKGSRCTVFQPADFELILHGKIGKGASRHPFTFKIKHEPTIWEITSNETQTDIQNQKNASLFAALRDFFDGTTVDTIRRSDLPHPISKPLEFEHWADKLMAMGIKISNDQQQHIADYSEEAFARLLDYFGIEHPGMVSVVQTRAEAFYNKKRFEEAIQLYQITIDIFPENLYKIMEGYFLLDQYELVFCTFKKLNRAYRSAIPATVLTLIIKALQNRQNKNKLQVYQLELKELKKINNFNQFQGFIEMGLAFIHCLNGNRDKAYKRVNKITFPNRYIQPIARKLFCQEETLLSLMQ